VFQALTVQVRVMLLEAGRTCREHVHRIAENRRLDHRLSLVTFDPSRWPLASVKRPWFRSAKGHTRKMV
jgi:hypothetical protein